MARPLAPVSSTFGNQYFTKVEYRHTFDTNRSVDTNTGVIGLGLRF
jgi:hypothetical protein